MRDKVTGGLHNDKHHDLYSSLIILHPCQGS